MHFFFLIKRKPALKEKIISLVKLFKGLKSKSLFFTHILHFAFFNLHSAFCNELQKAPVHALYHSPLLPAHL